jgi:hypothetical protein
MKNKIRKRKETTNMDKEISKLKELFLGVEDTRAKNSSHKLSDILMSGFAMFNLKHSSLLSFEQQNEVEKANLKEIFGIEKICSDAQLRKVLDTVNPDFIRKNFSEKFHELEQNGFISRYGYQIGSKKYLILSSDGVQHFSSKKCNCNKCLTKKHRNGSITYHHNMLCCALVHPDYREVFVMDAEPILNEDGAKKNDCELNAAKRLFDNIETKYARSIEKYNFLLVEDALYANQVHIESVLEKGMNFLINVKPGSHKNLFSQYEKKKEKNQIKKYKIIKKGITHIFEYMNSVLLNGSTTMKVNFLHYTQIDKKGKKTVFTWVTNLALNKRNVFKLMRAGRARWKIENETFNTLKNLGYHFEHNYGHGKDHLSTMFAFLMLLAFLVDQIVQISCHIFRTIEHHIFTKIKLWQSLKSVFHTIICSSMEQIYQKIALLFNINIEKKWV